MATLVSGKGVSSLTSVGAGAENELALIRMGLLGVSDLISTLSLMGYCFTSTGTAGKTDGETGEIAAASQAIDPTEPTFMFDVPSGTTVIPLEVGIDVEAATYDGVFAIMYDSVNRYNTGGVAAVAARNLRTDSPRASTVINLYSGDTALTADAATAERLIWIVSHGFADVSTGPLLNTLWSVRQNATLPILVGPASFLVYCHHVTAAAEIGVCCTWAELPSDLVTAV